VDFTEADTESTDRQVELLLNYDNIGQQLKTLLKKYQLNCKICLKCPQNVLVRQLGSRTELAKFFEERSYRKKFLADLLNKPSNNDLPIMERLAQLEELNYR